MSRTGLPPRGGPGPRRARPALLWAALFALVLLPAPAGADPTPPRTDKDADGIAPVYLLEAVRVRGNEKTEDYVIRRALQVRPGMRLSVDDPRFQLSRFRVLALGYFSDARLELKKGSRHGRVVLVVTVVERGTIVLTDLWFGNSEATRVWGGAGLAENNFLGHGIRLAGAFVIGSNSMVDESRVQHAYLLELGSPRFLGTSLSLNLGLWYRDGSDFFRASGPESTSDPDDYIAIRYRRIGGTIGAGYELLRFVRAYLDYRVEVVDSDLPVGAVRLDPGGRSEPIDFGIKDGTSVLSNVALTVERDTRNDPVLPHEGSLISVTAEFSSPLTGSGYDYVKLFGRYQHLFPLSWGHVFSFELAGGVLFGEPPFFEKFFVGDFNHLVPSRVMGLNFSTLPSRDIFGTSIDSKRYEEFAARLAIEYVVPWFRGGRFFYGGDFFLTAGVLMLTSRDALRVRDRDLSESIPVDLTLDAGLRLDTLIGTFHLSIGNVLGRIPF